MGKQQDGYSCGLYVISAMRRFGTQRSDIYRICDRAYHPCQLEMVRNASTTVYLNVVLKFNAERGDGVTDHEAFLYIHEERNWGEHVSDEAMEKVRCEICDEDAGSR